MDDFALETRQVTNEAFFAFGISLNSTGGRAAEWVEMLHFCQLAAQQGLHTLVKSLVYDSSAALCTIELFEESLWMTEQGAALRDCAAQSLTQSQWDGTVYHGAALLDDCDF
ncbi:hypothetical protein GALL_482550 [mine drainage metagenome]|uniref:Uncharacterized protein n=1 Tax=mine drainage metagenome TaxID=410659 RepID=A0A1J5PH81_9ZZZZ